MPPTNRKLASKVVNIAKGVTDMKASKMEGKRSKNDDFRNKIGSLVQPAGSSGRGAKKSRTSAVPTKGQRLGDAFFEIPGEQLARKLLGQTMVRQLSDGRRLAGRIVETEAYPGGPDLGSCSHDGRQTAGNAGVFMKPGTAYVYMTYGMYYCFNISSGGHGSAVLFRALEPLDGLDVMRAHRGAKRKDGGASLKDWELCAGPSKLCMALDISKALLDQRDLATSNDVWIERGDDVADPDIVATARIGLGARAGAWQSKPYRFYVRGSFSVSVRDAKAEEA